MVNFVFVVKFVCLNWVLKFDLGCENRKYILVCGDEIVELFLFVSFIVNFRL